MNNIPKGSRLFAWFIGVASVALSAYLKDNIYWTAGIPSAVLLYSNKQYNERKKDEINK